MSWAGITATASVDEVGAKLDEAISAYNATDPGVIEQITAAASAVKTIVASGAVGNGSVTVSISGHANPDHKPTAGWANDTISVSVYCADTLAAEPETPAEPVVTDAPAEPEQTGDAATPPAVAPPVEDGDAYLAADEPEAPASS